MRLRSAILNCPSFTLNQKKVYKTFEHFLKSLKNSKQLREAIYIKTEVKNNSTKYYAEKLGVHESTIDLKIVDNVGRKNFIPENVRNFAFNFVRNRLKLSAQRSHFTEVDKNCLLCKKNYQMKMSLKQPSTMFLHVQIIRKYSLTP